MVSISTGLTLGLIATAVLGFYKLGGASGIGSRLGGGFSSLFDSFGSSLNPVQAAIDKNNAENPALNPILVAQARFEEATTLDPNLSADRFVDPAGKYDPVAMGAKKFAEAIAPTPANFMDQFTFTDRPTRPTTPVITYGPLPQYAGTLEYVTQNMVSAPYEGPTQSKPTTLDYNFLGNFGV